MRSSEVAVLSGLAAHVNEARLWSRHVQMAKIGGTERGGVHRLPFTSEDVASRQLFLTWAEARGFPAEMDEFGNIFVKRRGTDSTALPVTSGSHSDTQPRGGRFDGIYGVLAAFEALEAMEDAGARTKHPVEAVIWSAEEGDARFGVGCLGSQAYADPSKVPVLLAKCDNEGVTVKQALAEMMQVHPKLRSRPLNSPVSSYVEAHIEQGPELEASGKTIGVVTAIHGHRWFKVEITGEAGHAGNTPERLRKDALVSAVRIISELRKIFHDPSDTVRFTVGRMELVPNAIAVIPGSVTFTIDFRHPDEETLTYLGDQVEVVTRANAGHCDVNVTELRRAKTTQFKGVVPETILAITKRLGYSWMHIASGAGHDARYIAEICPTGMVFVPCWRGISHNEMEDATPSDLAAGARVLTETLFALAK